MKVGFGLDLGGFSKKGTVLAALEIGGSKATVFILSGSPFAEKIRGEALLAARIEKESRALKELLNRGPLAVDVPIYLQNLEGAASNARVWELTFRPVDKAFSGLPPLASWLGACVARFKALRNCLHCFSECKFPVFETYPAASLELVGLPCEKYKKGKESDGVRGEIQKGLGLQGDILAHDDLDAAICALTAIASDENISEGHALKKIMLERSGEQPAPDHSVPSGYRLLSRKRPYGKVEVRHCDYNKWLQQRSK